MADWLGLPITRTEDWDDGTVVTWLAHPFPVERKPFAPSKVVDEARLRKIPFDLLIATQDEVTKRGVEKHLTHHDVPPLVYLYGGRYYIADGHHRITAKWLIRHTTGDTDVLARVALVPEEYRAPIKRRLM